MYLSLKNFKITNAKKDVMKLIWPQPGNHVHHIYRPYKRSVGGVADTRYVTQLILIGFFEAANMTYFIKIKKNPKSHVQSSPNAQEIKVANVSDWL